MLVTVSSHSQNNLSRILISIELLLKEENGIRFRASHLSISIMHDLITLAKGETENALTQDIFAIGVTRN